MPEGHPAFLQHNAHSSQGISWPISCSRNARAKAWICIRCAPLAMTFPAFTAHKLVPKTALAILSHLAHTQWCGPVWKKPLFLWPQQCAHLWAKDCFPPRSRLAVIFYLKFLGMLTGWSNLRCENQMSEAEERFKELSGMEWVIIRLQSLSYSHPTYQPLHGRSRWWARLHEFACVGMGQK